MEEIEDRRKAGREITLLFNLYPRELRAAQNCVVLEKLKVLSCLVESVLFSLPSSRSIPLDLISSFLDFFFLRTFFITSLFFINIY